MNYPFDEIREFYRWKEPYILQAHNLNRRKFTDPYRSWKLPPAPDKDDEEDWHSVSEMIPRLMEMYDAGYIEMGWMKIMSPIEQQTWQAIRGFGLAPLYPQYPVGKYFVDFGHPGEKVAVECDGKAYHADTEKDLKRAKEIISMGWTIYRISGKDCNRPVSNDYYNRSDLDEYKRNEILQQFFNTTIEGLIAAIGLVHFRDQDECDPDEYDMAVSVLNERSDF